MIRPGRISATRQIRHALSAAPVAPSQALHYGRSTTYRRLLTYDRSQHYLNSSPPVSLFPSSATHSFVPRSHPLSIFRLLSQGRSLHTSAPRFQQPRAAEDVKDPPREDGNPEAKAEDARKESSEEGGKNTDSEEGSSESKGESKEKKDAPPPPPHGDKTPWQVFTETLRSEFKASKEWNEGTKQLASSAHQFTESEGVRRARAAYDATAGAATTKTAEAIKSTGRVLGQGAAWTWDTKVVQGLREGVNATGRGIEKATRPVRETQAFQNIKEAVDDGSSSRYGGWIEKEERRKKRELRDMKETGRRPVEKMEEDPKYASTQPSSVIKNN
jgi:mitochondrial import inner membrane translocase subunit TIM44